MPFTPRLVFVTAASMEEARGLAQGLLEKHLAACVNLVPNLESHYWWKGKRKTATEILMVIKSSAEQFEKLETYIHYIIPTIVLKSSWSNLIKWPPLIDNGGESKSERRKWSKTFPFDPLQLKAYGQYPLWQKNSVMLLSIPTRFTNRVREVSWLVF